MSAELIKRLRDAMGGLQPLTGQGEDNIWRPANKAWEALRAAADALEGHALVPTDPGSCELDDSGWLLAFMHELHADVETGRRPESWGFYSDRQRERIKAAYCAMLSAASVPNAPL